MSEIREFREPGRGWFWWWFDRAIILTIAGIFFCLYYPFCRVKTQGRKNLPHSGAVLCLSNHPSTIGTFAVLVAVFWPWVLKQMAMIPVVVGKWKYLKWTGPAQWILWHFNVIAVCDKSEAGKRTGIVRAEVNLLTKVQNCLLWLFAEGTRTEPGKGLMSYSKGIGRVVAEILPDNIVFIWEQGSAEACPKGEWSRWQIRWLGNWLPIPSRCPVAVFISKPISAADATTKLYDLCHEGAPAEIAQRVAEYLRDLHWAFAVHYHPELAKIEAVNPEVLDDLKQIINQGE